MMEKEGKRVERRTTRQPYRKPQLKQVKLVVKEAVLSGCKTGDSIIGPLGPPVS